MKRKFYYAFFFLLTFYNSNKILGQSANTKLSNLTSPTQINADLLPNAPGTFNIGRASKSWQNVYLKGRLFLDGARFISNTGTENTFIGSSADSSITTGHTNSANGYHALYFNGTGSINTANGAYSLYANTVGNYNTATGAYSMNSNTAGEHNTANGRAALYHNSTGNYNTAMGDEALYENSKGSNNIAIGNTALGDNTLGNDNTAIGNSALLNNTSGYSNTAVGTHTLYKNTTGNDLVAVGDSALYNQNGGFGANTAIGNKAMLANTTGYYNTALGLGTLYSNTTGNYNTSTGLNALYFNNADYNTANGYFTLYHNGPGTDNTAIGAQALFGNSTGNYNTATGVNTLYSNLSGNYNAAFGISAMFSNANGYDNTAIGSDALYSNNSGYYNFAGGVAALYRNTTGFTNTACGWAALYSNTTGAGNTSVGDNSLVNTTTGIYNTAVGNGALAGLFIGNYNTAIGNLSGNFNFTEMYNSTSIGDEAEPAVDNQVRVGNGSVSSIGGAVDWTSFSDERIKTNIKENVPGLTFINLLKPVTYHFSLTKEKELMGKTKDSTNWRSKYDIEKTSFTGLLAQEVDKAAKQINYDFSGVDKAGNIWGLRYAAFVTPLIKAVQELSKQNDSLQNKIDAQQAINTGLENRIARLESMMKVSGQPVVNGQQAMVNNAQAVNVFAASLSQNIPNPFSNTTTINYALPQQFSSAKIIITDKNGNTLKQINLSNTGKGSVQIDASILTSGTYQYALIVDGRMIGSKQMLLIK